MINDYGAYIKEKRRFFHAIPEIAYNEFKTQKHIIEELESLGVEYRVVGTGVIADIFNEKKPSFTIAFRSDIDALPITERGDKPYKSRHEGLMHACGHDGHISLLLGFIKYCAQNRQKLNCNCRFIFQPAEEAQGGALNMIENGALDGVDEIYAVHIDPAIKKGFCGIGQGVSLAGAYEFDISARGESSHCAEKSKGKDALRALMYVIEKTYETADKKVFNDDILFHCGKLCGGSARNIVAENAEANCTLRYFDYNDLDRFLHLINDVISDAAKRWNTEFSINMLCNYIPLENDNGCVNKVKKYIKHCNINRKYVAEDFAFYLREVKGCLIWLGTDDGGCKKLHSPDFDFDESALMQGFNLYKSLVEE